MTDVGQGRRRRQRRRRQRDALGPPDILPPIVGPERVAYLIAVPFG